LLHGQRADLLDLGLEPAALDRDRPRIKRAVAASASRLAYALAQSKDQLLGPVTDSDGWMKAGITAISHKPAMGGPDR